MGGSPQHERPHFLALPSTSSHSLFLRYAADKRGEGGGSLTLKRRLHFHFYGDGKKEKKWKPKERLKTNRKTRREKEERGLGQGREAEEEREGGGRGGREGGVNYKTLQKKGRASRMERGKAEVLDNQFVHEW